MTTPQRALGTLEFLQGIARRLDPHFPAPTLSDEERAAACQAIYHYAEIMQAEVVAYARESDLDALKTRSLEPWASMIYVSSHRMKTDLVTTELIIKPKPLP